MKYILVVEDDPINQLIIEDYLQDYEINLIDDGQKCLDEVNKRKPDIILLDIAIPTIDGYQVCQKLKSDKAYQDIPIIMVTAYAREKEKNKALEIGANDYLTKPFKYESLMEIIKKYI
ncbi:MAG: response regulator [Gammaproteobacteria bacterium]|nr:response regulator [Gammaproteobacteria bacterium]